MSFFSLWDAVASFFNGKIVVVLGQRATGKTSLLTYLLTGQVVTKHEATVGVEKITKDSESFRRMKEIGWDVRLCNSLKDYSGSSDNHKNHWIQAAKDSHIFIYLFKVNEWLEYPERVESQIETDIEFLGPNMSGKKMGIFLIGTHTDLVDYKVFPQYRDKSKLADAISGDKFFKLLKSKFPKDQVPVIYCSNLNTEKGLERLIKIMFKEISAKG